MRIPGLFNAVIIVNVASEKILGLATLLFCKLL